MMRRPGSALFGGVLLALVVAGCGSGGSATLPPASTNSPSVAPTSASLPYGGAPKVDHPLPVSVISGDPCADGLTSQQLTQIIGIAPQGKPSSDNVGATCNWVNSDTNSHVTVAFDTKDHTGLSGFYENTKPQAVVWKPLPAIQGFPAVAHVSTGNDSKDFCQISIGIADDLSVDVTIRLSDAKVGKADPCEMTGRVAEMVITNLRQKAGA
jgi:hypothetical protein